MGKAAGIFKIFKALFKGGKLFGKGSGGAGWLFALILLSSLFKKKKKAPEPVVAATNYESPTYSFGGGISTTISADNAPIPLVFGKHAVGGQIVNSFVSSGDLGMQYEERVVSATSLTFVSFTSATGASVYKLSEVPSTTAVSLVLVVPNLDLLLGSLHNAKTQYSNLQYNAKILIEYSFNGVDYTFSKSINYQEYVRDYQYATWGGLNTNQLKYNNLISKGVLVPLVNDTPRDIWVRVSLQNATIFTYGGMILSPNTAHYYGQTVKEVNLLAFYTAQSTYIRIKQASYTVPIMLKAGGAVNQKLYMDVVLSAGEIRNLHNVYVNDRHVFDMKSDNKQGGVERNTIFHFRPGFEAIPDMNTEDTLNFQSTIYNQNDTPVDRLTGSVMSQDTVVGDDKIYLEDTSPFIGVTYISWNENRQDQYPHTVTSVTNDYITISSVFGSVVAAGTPVFIYKDETPTYNDFQYATQTDDVDALVIGLNAHEGLFNTNTDTGALYNREVSVSIKVSHATLSDGSSATFPLYDGGSGTDIIHSRTLVLRGCKRSKLWYDITLKDELIPNPLNGEKKYLVEIRKLTDSTFSEYARNKLQVAYVEELVNKEITYNGCAYVGMTMTANSKVNNGTPNLLFEVDGLLLPHALPQSISLNTDASTETTFYTQFNTSFSTSTNYITGDDTQYTMSGFLVYHDNRLYSLLDDQNLHYYSNSAVSATFHMLYDHFYKKIKGDPASLGQNGWPFFKAFFKCGDTWYKRYVAITQQRAPGAPIPPSSPEHYRNKITIADFSEGYVDLHLVTDVYYDFNWLVKNNTALPSVPTDMILYQWSNNPAWIILFLLCDDINGAGIPYENIDLDSFKDAAAYYSMQIDNPITSVPDDTIKRCAVNFIIDNYADLRTHLEKLLTICHGALYNSNDKIKFLVERKVEESEIIVDLDEERDLLDLSVHSVPAKDMPNQLSVSFLDENDKYVRRSIVVEDASLSKSKGYQSVQRQDMEMFGLTNESHVMMEAMRTIKAGKYVKFGIQFKTALSGLPLEVYDVFTLSSTTYGWVNKKFRVIDIKFTANKEVEIGAIEYYDEIYELEEDDMIKYHEVQHTSFPALTEAPLPVKNLTIFEEAVRNNAGSVQVNLVGHFNKPEDITFNDDGDVIGDDRYQFNKTNHVLVTLYHASASDGTYRVLRNKIRFDGDEFRFNNLEIGGWYKVSVEAASLANAVSEPAISSVINLTGKKLPPLDITGASWQRHEFDHAQFILTWTPNTTDYDMKSYVIRFATSTGSWDTYEYQYISPYTKEPRQEFYFSPSLGIDEKNIDFGKTTNTNFKIIIKCLDTSGNYSENGFTLTASATVEPDAPSNIVVTHLNADDDYPFTITWDKPDTDVISQYLVKIGSATSDWDTAQYSYTISNPTLTLNNGSLGTHLHTVADLRLMIKSRNRENRLSSIATATINLTLAPTTVEGGTIELDPNGTIIVGMPEAPSNKDFSHYIAKITTHADPETTGGVSDAFRAYAGSVNRRRTIPVAYDNITFYLHYAAIDMYGHTGDYVTTSLLADVVPSHVSATQMSYTLTNTGINLKLPDKSAELSWDCYEFHISSSSGFTPSTATTFLGTARSNQYPINAFPDDTPLAGASTYYVKVRSRSKYAPDKTTYYSAYSADLAIVTSDATAPVLYVNSTTPSISPINVIIGDTITVNYSVTDNGALDRTRGRVYHIDHIASATWIDPIDEDEHTFDLFPSSTDGQYVLQLTAFDAQGNYANYVTNFSRDTATASAPGSVSATQIGSTGVQVTIEAPTNTLNIKEYIVEYAVDTGGGYSSWIEIKRTVATTFVESLAAAGAIKFRVKVTKLHTNTLDSDYTESAPITLDTVGPSILIDYTTPDISADPLLTSDTVTFHYISSDNTGFRANDPIMYSLDSGALATATTLTLNVSGTEASGTVVLESLADGNHYISFKAYDVNNNTTDTMIFYFTVDTTVPADLDAPTLAINGRTITIKSVFEPTANFSHLEYAIYDASDDSLITSFKK
jgi:hypothetical protein